MKTIEEPRVYDTDASIAAFREAELDRWKYWFDCAMDMYIHEPEGPCDRRRVYFMSKDALYVKPKDERTKRHDRADA